MKKKASITLEILNDRLMLAGDCFVAIEDGVATIECDSNDNSLNISQFGLGLTIESNAGTKFNGEDTLELVDVSTLEISTGNGDDDVLLTNVSVDEVMIDTGNGSDDVIVAAAFSSLGDLHVDTGNGNDNIGLLLFLASAGNVYLNGGNGDDCISANPNASLVQNLNLDGGRGHDTGGSTAPATITNIEVDEPFCGV